MELHVPCCLNTVKKASKHLYSLRQLKQACIPCNDLQAVQFYYTCIRSVVEYASPLFHYALPAYLSDELEHIQKWSLSTVMAPGISYSDALQRLGIATLNHRQIAKCVIRLLL